MLSGRLGESCRAIFHSRFSYRSCHIEQLQPDGGHFLDSESAHQMPGQAIRLVADRMRHNARVADKGMAHRRCRNRSPQRQAVVGVNPCIQKQLAGLGLSRTFGADLASTARWTNALAVSRRLTHYAVDARPIQTYVMSV